MTDLARHGHFVFESGHHGDTWLDLDALITDPARLRAAAADLADLLRGYAADVVVGPLDGGAFLGQFVAAELGTRFAYTTRAVVDGLPSYALPPGIDARGQRAVIVDDAINQGSATEATASALTANGAHLIALASVIVCAPSGRLVGERLGVPQVWLTEVDTRSWLPADCPECA
ncbi:phosphoribosyltransferase family protein [Actinokineospora sp. HUAS TT18]|uniref:phosphoribosyltransferase family protein n=1 Tax=Actinokineospora sp. HUAS TT18 TaxID=3447451 RepID=UPI003F525993